MVRGIQHLLTSVIALVSVVLGIAMPASASQPTTSEPPTLVIFTDGVDWSNIDPDTTPHLAAWAASGTMANVVPPNIRGWVCPRDVTLAMSAGEPLHSRSLVEIADCPTPRFFAGQMPDAWDAWFYQMQRDGDTAPIGNAAAVLTASGITYGAIGTSGATFLIAPDGRIPDTYADVMQGDDQLAAQVQAILPTVDLLTVDASVTDFSADPHRNLATEQREAMEADPSLDLEPVDNTPQLARYSSDEVAAANVQRADAILAAVQPGTRVVFMSLTDVAGSSLQPAFISYGPVDAAHGAPAQGSTDASLGSLALGTDPKVRQPGTVTYRSMATTILAATGAELTGDPTPNKLGTDVVTATGKDVSACAATDPCFTDRQASLDDASLRSTAIGEVRGTFFRIMQLAAIAFIILTAALYILRRGRNVIGSRPWAALGAAISAVPVASHIDTLLVPWWRAENPTIVLVSTTWAIAAVIAIVAVWLASRFNYGPYLVVAGLTAALFLGEVATGSTNLIDAPMGFNTLIGARFYGLGNEGFAIVAVSVLVVLAFLPRTKIGLGIAALLGLGALAVVAHPDMGADFGGALALLPSLGLLLLFMSGRRPSLKTLLIVALAGGAFAFAVAFADYLRPDRTHLGNFVQAIIDGEAWEIIWRKMSVNLRLLTSSSHRWVVLAGLVAIVTVVVPRLRKARGRIESDEASAPHPDTRLTHGLITSGVCMALAFTVNDSGIVLPGMGMIVSLPALLPLIVRR